MEAYSGRRGQLHTFLSSSETKKCRTKFFKQILWNTNDEVALYEILRCAKEAMVKRSRYIDKVETHVV
jgi:hypothetical protein